MDPIKNCRLWMLAGGGRIKVPCLRIDEGGETRWIYESEDIVAYLDDRFGRDGDQADRTAREAAYPPLRE